MVSRSLTRCSVFIHKEAVLKAVNTVIVAGQIAPKPMYIHTRFGYITRQIHESAVLKMIHPLYHGL